MHDRNQDCSRLVLVAHKLPTFDQHVPQNDTTLQLRCMGASWYYPYGYLDKHWPLVWTRAGWRLAPVAHGDRVPSPILHPCAANVENETSQISNICVYVQIKLVRTVAPRRQPATSSATRAPRTIVLSKHDSMPRRLCLCT